MIMTTTDLMGIGVLLVLVLGLNVLVWWEGPLPKFRRKRR